MKVILIDDEPVMHLIMRKMLAKYAELQIVGAFADTHAAADFLAKNTDVELAFVDISMPGDNGLTFASRLDQVGCKTQIVFVTSHKDYAVDAFELSVLDYLVKPVTQERLERTIHRALEGRKRAEDSQTANAQTQNANRVSITALGDFSVRNERGRVKWISSKSVELFAYLLLNRGRRISRARLVADIFAGMTSVNAEKYLNTTVYQLRKSLEPLALRDAIRSENDGYALELADAMIDFEEFERQASKFKRIDAANMEDALNAERLYTGDLFGSKAYVWAIHETDRLAELYTSFVKNVVEALLVLSNTAAASKLLLKLYAQNPLDESVLSLLLRKHAQDGNKKGLTAQYIDYVRLIKKELGIRPSKALLLLYDSLVSELSDNANN
ncbi:Two-component response regulator, SAPR family, consists of REC, wHTH and BTAD domains [Paenibacillus algorifonticola]|uniref:Two-component response regulator, SAPR family, consists of REC, wHTH and BTAD domains n=1 Tax=Paenibacillus algorifonticola TaxID=684063 RepID=A0A1I2D3V5_9BACL|nr:response regulator [Paenibacillus algorifonticola]SFE74660.1 Two-component response regulator, SAPR family, consists of REC, wHTH and BTAD domains [Paenibacillus algorifonticola]